MCLKVVGKWIIIGTDDDKILIYSIAEDKGIILKKDKRCKPSGYVTSIDMNKKEKAIIAGY